MNKFEFKNLTPFKWFVLENFPFIEADFDALTEWQLFCKLGKEINKIIDSQNVVGEQAETLTNAFNNLKNYVDNYFENLDVQEEINTKLNQMAEDGTLKKIINQDIFNELNEKVNKNTEELNILLENSTIMIGDSYGVGTTSGGTIVGWCDRLKTFMKLNNNNYFKFVEGSAGFLRKGLSGHTFLTLLQSNLQQISDKTLIKNIIVCGGYNDNSFESSELNTAVWNFVDYCYENFKNATVYVGMIGNNGANTETGAAIRNNLSERVLRCYQNAVTHGAIYLNGVENIMHDYYAFMSADNIHPNDLGYGYLATYIYQALKSGYASYHSLFFSSTNEFTNIESDSNFNIYSMINDNVVNMFADKNTLNFTQPVNIRDNFNLGKINIAMFRQNRRIIEIPVKFYLYTTDSKFYGGFGYLQLNYDGNLLLKVEILDNSGSSYLTINNVKQIVFDAFNVTFPTRNC